MAKLVLNKGAHKGKTVTLQGHHFINGELPLKGSLVQNEGIIKYMALCYQAELVATSEEMIDGERNIPQNAQRGTAKPVSGNTGPDGSQPTKENPNDGGANDVSKTGSTGSLPQGDGHEHAGVSPQAAQIIAALGQLDHTNDNHWTGNGKPACDAVAAIMNSGNVTRAQIEAAAPGFKRKVA